MTLIEVQEVTRVFVRASNIHVDVEVVLKRCLHLSPQRQSVRVEYEAEVFGLEWLTAIVDGDRKAGPVREGSAGAACSIVHPEAKGPNRETCGVEDHVCGAVTIASRPEGALA